MSAPKTAYRKYSQFLRQGTANIEHLIAKLQISDATHKQRFYLDGYMSAKLPDGTDGALGYVALGSVNSNMHNLTTRGGVIRGMAGGQVVQLLNDAGLNTLGRSDISDIELNWANNVRVLLEYISAWYLDSTQIGIRFRKNGSTSWNTLWIDKGYVAKQNVLNRKILFESLSEKGDGIEIQSIIVNNEGVFYSSSKNVLLDDNIYNYDAFKRNSACNDTGQEVISFWITQGSLDLLPEITEVSSSTGVFIWNNIEATSPVSDGWIFGIDNNKSFEVVGGELVRYEECTLTLPIIFVSAEQDAITGLYVVHVSLSSKLDYNVTINGRMDISDPSTINAKPFSITIPSGNQIAQSQEFDLSDGTYRFYNVSTTPSGFDLIVQQGNIN